MSNQLSLGIQAGLHLESEPLEMGLEPKKFYSIGMGLVS